MRGKQKKQGRDRQRDIAPGQEKEGERRKEYGGRIHRGGEDEKKGTEAKGSLSSVP